MIISNSFNWNISVSQGWYIAFTLMFTSLYTAALSHVSTKQNLCILDIDFISHAHQWRIQNFLGKNVVAWSTTPEAQSGSSQAAGGF